MNTTNMAVASGALVMVGRWSQDKGMDVRIVVGVVVLAILLSALPDPVAGPMAALILTAVLFTYGPGIIKKTGIAAKS